MSQDISVQYFSPKAGSKEFDLGGGYITSGILKTSFRAIKSNNEFGFFISLPQKQDAEGKYKDIVSFTNKETHDLFARLVADKMKGGTPASSAPSARPAGQKPPYTPSNSVRNTAPKSQTSEVPGDDTPW